ncbi:hypothetical protein PC9H_001844 [Pleurotus ostreatus]|uniref:NAD(P)-binding protein n=1 Tax=Pleurotus ostreatus TaxID=5322 RepID=A0A8H7DMJ8_PLEOS|nr:uncharacterized protein PC9H_001844 [Pleurotus ostreatus]KAF7419257.1 hypothetical protein PC9H_001844 [Pleurotus ostreatus]
MSEPSFKGVAIITGAAEGIGRGIALRLVSDGFDVAINDIPAKKSALEQLISEITSSTPRRAIAVPGDVSNDGDVKGIVDKAVQELGGLDVMIANAGIAVNKPIAETTTDEWDRLFAVNVRGTFLCYKHAADAMIKQGRGGRILGACSIAGKKGEFDGYQATKKGLKPGEWTETVRLFLRIMKQLTKVTVWWGQLKSTVAVGKNGTPTEIASLVSYLVSKDAHFITGQSIIVDGGGIFD